MKTVRSILAVALALGCFGGLVLAENDSVTMKGSFVWERSDKDIPGDIEAVFTPSGDESWDVVWHFEWEGEMRAWKGTATGSLEEGKLEGEAVEDRDRERTFAFKGKIANGVFTGKHGAERDGEWHDLGSLTLSR